MGIARVMDRYCATLIVGAAGVGTDLLVKTAPLNPHHATSPKSYALNLAAALLIGATVDGSRALVRRIRGGHIYDESEPEPTAAPVRNPADQRRPMRR
jgi:hypothetical protein